MEDSNGLFYFLQVKSFECEGVQHDWQLPFNPVKTHITMNQEELAKLEEANYWQDLYSKCQVKILCNQLEAREWFISASQKNELWDFPTLKKLSQPCFKTSVIDRY